jgi:hypothetical protein
MVIKNGKKFATIYKMEDVNTGYYYIGSTFNGLKHRKQQHKKESERSPDRKVYRYINDWSNVKMTCLLEFECENKQQRDQREYNFICNHFDDEMCVNSIKTGTGFNRKEWQKQYNEENKEKITEYRKEYYNMNKETHCQQMKQHYEANKEVIKERHKKYYVTNKEKFNQKYKCKCGGQYTHTNKTKHEKTKKHIQYMESKP